MAPKRSRGEPAPLPPLQYYVARELERNGGKGKATPCTGVSGKGAKGLASPHPSTLRGLPHPNAVRPRSSSQASAAKLITPVSERPSTSQASSSSTSLALLPAYEKSELARVGKPDQPKQKQVQVRNLTRGDKRKALEIAGDPELLKTAMADYEKDWRSAGDTSDFNVKTWRGVHGEVNWTKFGLDLDLPVTPLTPLKITVVGSAMKGGGYRSCKNYLDAIKRVHVDEGHGWNEQLSLASKRYHASTSRGMGPAMQSAPLDFMKMRELNLNDSVSNPLYPARPGAAAVMATFWLLRDLEATTAEYRDMLIDRAARKVTLILSMSKNDPRALGCERSWGCVCEDGVHDHRACPFHAAVDLDDFIKGVLSS